MEQTIQIILETLAANGGVMSWETMLAAIPQENRRYVWDALRELQNTNQAKPQNRYDAQLKTGVFEIVAMGG